MITLSRNIPAALVVGAGGFIGSTLSDKLLGMRVQVVGVDDFSRGKRQNVIEAGKNKNFHLLTQSAELPITVDFPRLDYAFFILPEDLSRNVFQDSLRNFLKVCENKTPKIVLISSIELYDNHADLPNLEAAEKIIASFAMEKKANARVVRLASVYGPRMHFRMDDPIARLCRAAVLGTLQKEGTPLDFTSRALFIDDAVNLLVKAVMHSGTSQKIYDGVLKYPIKVAEIKQILLDPLWHESRGFTPTELPPWVTPNLARTESELSWKPSAKIITSLKETMQFFQKNPERIEPQEKKKEDDNQFQKPLTKEEKSEAKLFVEDKSSTPKKIKKGSSLRNKTFFLAGLLFIAYALVYPVGILALNIWEVKSGIGQINRNLAVGDLQKAEAAAKQTQMTAVKIKGSIAPVTGFLSTDALTIWNGTDALVSAEASFITSINYLNQTLGYVFEGKEGSSLQFSEALASLNKADNQISETRVVINKIDPQEFIAPLLNPWLKSLKNDLATLQNSIVKTKSLTQILTIALAGQKNYLLILTNNSVPNSGGGQVVTYGDIALVANKLSDIKTHPAEPEVWDTCTSEVSFTSNAKNCLSTYQTLSGKNADGVIMLDTQATANLLKVLGSVNLPDQKIEATADNLPILAEDTTLTNEFWTAFFQEFLNRFFFLSNQSWLRSAQVLNEEIQGKHFLIYLADPTLATYLQDQKWDSVFPVFGLGTAGERQELLSLSESGLEATKINLQSMVSESGGVESKLNLNYNNLDQENRKILLKVYLAPGTRLTGAKWGSDDYFKNVSSISDFNLAVYSLSLDLGAGEAKELVLDYQNSKPVELKDGKLLLEYQIVKQIGTAGAPITFNLRYPAVFTIDMQGASSSLPQEITITDNLNRDLNWKINFKKD